MISPVDYEVKWDIRGHYVCWRCVECEAETGTPMRVRQYLGCKHTGRRSKEFFERHEDCGGIKKSLLNGGKGI